MEPPHNSLPRKARRGSKPRCHYLTHGADGEVAHVLTSLAANFATVSAADKWMPQGFVDVEECELHRAPRLLSESISEELRRWWLPRAQHRAKTPNFDIASTCTIGGVPGLLLVEAKAHDEELTKEACGRPLSRTLTDSGGRTDFRREESHQTIGDAIAAASAGLAQATSVRWDLSRDRHYQMSNRFAWAWKLSQLGIPVVLIYLGFLRAHEMADRGRPFADHADWETLVKSHSEPLFPARVWGQSWDTGGAELVPLIRSIEVPLGAAPAGPLNRHP